MNFPSRTRRWKLPRHNGLNLLVLISSTGGNSIVIEIVTSYTPDCLKGAFPLTSILEEDTSFMKVPSISIFSRVFNKFFELGSNQDSIYLDKMSLMS